MEDLVSIIMPSYNCGKYIEDTIRSVQAQTYQNWEILFVDDCSTDNTEDIVLSYNDPHIRYFKNKKNSGAAVSRNWALREAKGRWIAFLDSDDIWKPEKIEHQIKFMEEHGYGFSCTERDVVDEDSKPLGQYITGPEMITKAGMTRYCWVGCLTAMYDASKVGLIQIADIKKNNDYAIWLKVIKKCDCYLLKENLASYRQRKGSISHDKLINLIKSHYILWRVAEEKNPIVAVYNTIQNLFFGVMKRLFYVKNTSK